MIRRGEGAPASGRKTGGEVPPQLKNVTEGSAWTWQGKEVVVVEVEKAGETQIVVVPKADIEANPGVDPKTLAASNGETISWDKFKKGVKAAKAIELTDDAPSVTLTPGGAPKSGPPAPPQGPPAPPPPVAQPATPREQKMALKDLIEKHKSEGADFKEVEQKKQKYFDALKKFQENRSRIGLMVEGVAGEMNSKEVKQLRKEWIEARAAIAKKQVESAEKRLDERMDKSGRDTLKELNEHVGQLNERRAKVLERYSRLVMFRSVVMGAEEEERQARVEGLASRERKLEAMDSKEKPMLERARAWYKKQPPGVRILTTSALMTGGAALAFGAGPVALAIGTTSAGLRWFAETRKDKNAKASKWARMTAMFTSVVGVVGALGDAAVAHAHEAGGTKEAAQEDLKRRGGLGNLADAKEFEKMSRERSKAAGVDDRIARDRRRGRIVGSVLGGALLGAYANSADTPQGAGEGLTAQGGAGGEGTAASGSSYLPDNYDEMEAARIKANVDPSETLMDPNFKYEPEGTVAVGGDQEVAATETAGGTPERPHGELLTETVDERGEGTDRLFRDLQENIRNNEQLSENPPATIQHILNSHENVLSRELGTEAYESSPDDNGLVTHMRETRVIIDNDHHVWIQQGDDDPQLWLESTDGGNGYERHDITPATTDGPATASETNARQSDAVREEGTVAGEGSGEHTGADAVSAEPEAGVGAGDRAGADAAATGPEAGVGAGDRAGADAVSAEPEAGVGAGDRAGADAPGGDPEAGAISGRPLGTPLEDRLHGSAGEGAGDISGAGGPIGSALEDRGLNARDGLGADAPGVGAEAGGLEGLAPASAEWVPGTDLPNEQSFFRFAELAENGKPILYANGLTPDEFADFAYQKGIDLRDTVVRFDEPVAKWNGIQHQITQVEFDSRGNLVAPPERLLDPSGNVQEYLDTRFLNERIA